MTKKKQTHNMFEKSWLDKSLENLEKSFWPPLDLDENSYLIKTCNNLRKKQIKDFSTEDLRIMIGQNIGLIYLIPVALKTLHKDILAEGDFYPGDLLKNVLSSDKIYWANSKDNWQQMSELFENNIETLKNAEVTDEIKKGWFDSYKDLKNVC